ncbi:M1 family metallopeptidase [Nocardioides pacificus]
MTGRARTALAGSALVVLLGAGGVAWVLADGPSGEPDPGSPGQGAAALTPAPQSVGAPDLALAEDEPREDSLYPEVGDPGVDALHYDLTLDWSPDTLVLDAEAQVTFRATADAASFRLDLAGALDVASVEVDGEVVEHRHDGKDLVVLTPVSADRRHVAVVSYSGTPVPARPPTRRADTAETGWTITESGEVWTMQEPYGAFTWYPVNDHPSDEAFYDIEVRVDAPWVGVANGVLTTHQEESGRTTTDWHLDEPAASYVVTVAIGDLEATEATSTSGVPLTYWTPRGDAAARTAVQETGPALDWAEELLGPYPFSSLGVVVVPSDSAMETQTMLTLGDTDYAMSPAVLVHEVVHQWYGNQVTPSDWRDLWMNEGMAMYLQGVWEAQDEGRSVDALMDDWARFEPTLRADAGPPGDFDRDAFGSSNVYYSPALMWHEVRGRVGHEAFWSMVRAWPREHDNEHATREDYLAWIEEETGTELTDLFDAWLLGEQSPARE